MSALPVDLVDTSSVWKDVEGIKDVLFCIIFYCRIAPGIFSWTSYMGLDQIRDLPVFLVGSVVTRFLAEQVLFRASKSLSVALWISIDCGFVRLMN